MDSLLAYASSDEEEDQEQPLQHQHKRPSDLPSQPASKFGGNLFSSLAPPKSQVSNPSPQTLTTTNPNSSVNSLFSSLPQPKTEKLDPFSLNPKPKKIVQFRPPITPSMAKIDDEDDEDDEDKVEERKKEDAITQAPSVKSFLSIIPAPRNSGSLGALPSSAGTGRRSILEAETPALSNSSAVTDTIDRASDRKVKSDNKFGGNTESFNVSSSSENYINYDNSYLGYGNGGANESANVIGPNYDDSNYGVYHSSYGPAAPTSDDYGDYGQYESKWIDRSSGDVEPEIMEKAVESVMRVPGKRGRNEIPQEIIEVKQDELMKNRPRADQVKLTGIAFGPSYQPASSGKGKPSKLHKRKHQIGTLYFDMRQKEMELAERRSKGFLTKAETQAKYGW